MAVTQDPKSIDDYQTQFENFSWNIPEEYNFGFEVVDKWAKDMTKLALVSIDKYGQGEYTTFYQLKTQSDRFANSLRRLGVKKGDRVLIMLQSIPEWYFAMIGMFKLGVIPMPGTVLLTEKDVKFRLDRAEGMMVITDIEHAADVEAIEKDCPTLAHKMLVGRRRKGWLNFDDEIAKVSKNLDMDKIEATKSEDPMLIYFTSGTTGHPKMVLHTHSYALGHEVTARFAQALTSNDLHLAVSETGWAKAAWGKLFGQMIVGAAILQVESPGRFDPEELMQALEDYGVTTFCAPPTVYRLLVQLDLEKYDLQLRHCMSAGEPLNPEVIREWKAAFDLDIYDFYGQTETVCVLSNFPFMPIKYGSIGKATPGHDVHIVDDDGTELPTHEEGNIVLYLGEERPPGLCKEYWKDEDEMAKAFRGQYYYTGDKAYKDEDGYFWFVGRSDDVIKSSGYRIGPFEVESALIEHPAVVESAVVGTEDPKGVRGIVVKAFVVLAEGYTASDSLTKELQNHVKDTTAPYKYPRIIDYVDELPKTISGKILRRELRKQ